MKKLILGIDGGNFEGKTVGPYGADSYKTNITEDTELLVEEVFGEDDMRFELDGRKGLAGTIAQFENPFNSASTYGLSKVHDNTKIRVLLAIYRYVKKFDLEVESFSIVVGQPYKTHTEDEKNKLKKMLQGSHPIIINGEAMTIKIGEVGVAPEGVAAFFGGNHGYSTAKVLDLGSGTINAISVSSMRVTNFNSDTFNYGTETMEHNKVVRGIIQDTKAKSWDKNDKVLVCGGSAGVLTEKIKESYINAEVFLPVIELVDKTPQVLETKFANASGFYNIARGHFK